ncbi:MAG: dephospho-CoA kinase [Clostridia bacterium]|nr:dephospho-CoA kinase [Clostridia bacterium]
MMRNRIIGIIGGSGTGKSLFCTVAEDMGYTVIDGDRISHEVLQTLAKDELVKAFGEVISDNNGTISRKVLGGIVFADAEKLKTLNSIMHKYIETEIENRITDKCVIDAAVLHQTPVFNKCTKIVAVVADKEIRLKRIMTRDNLDKKTALDRINSQLSNEQYKNLAHIVIENNGTEEEFKNKARECLETL